MGMYDYLGGQQIKIFYRPIFSKNDILSGKPITWHSGGNLYSYDVGDDLPLKTWYYKYPNDFIAYDYRSGEVWVIKNGTLKYYKDSYKELIESDLGDGVFDYYGNELNIKTLDDFNLIREEADSTENKCNEYEEQIFPNGIWNTPEEEWEVKKAEWDKAKDETWGTFDKKWYKEDIYALEKQLGEFFDCLYWLSQRKNDEVWDSYNPMEEFLSCEKATKNFIRDNEGVLNRYINWAEIKDDELVEFKEMLNELLQ